jgi:MinD-like ATPase involved in chromosome partitioning or flagellar assembly
MMLLLYTWKDVERLLRLNKSVWSDTILDIETYVNEIIIYIKKDTEGAARTILNNIFQSKYDSSTDKISLDFPGEFLCVFFETEETELKTGAKAPLFKNVLYQQSAYRDDMLEKNLPGVPVLAFHSYKGGVGRTLSLLAFVRAWSSLREAEETKKLLIVDADLEAPGITWLTAAEEAPAFSYLDLLEVTQEKQDINDIIETVSSVIAEQTVKIETEKSIVEHIVLPTYRYIGQLLDMYSSPESLAGSYNKKYVLAEVLSRLGEKVNAAMVLVDLRAGLSEFSAPLLFDPRVKKYLVTSTSYQSVKGTELLLEQLCKGLPLTENTLIPEILLTMVQPHINDVDIKSQFVAVFDRYKTDDNLTVTDDIVTVLPFASELVHLESLSKIMNALRERDLYREVLEIVRNHYFVKKEGSEKIVLPSRNEIIKRIHHIASEQITAEGNASFKVLMTDSIQNLIKKYKTDVPNTVVMGAKGSGKTFLYREILRSEYWESFIEKMDSGITCCIRQTVAVPLLESAYGNEFQEVVRNVTNHFNTCTLKGKIKTSICIDAKNELMEAKKQGNHDLLDWKKIWKTLILNAFGNVYASLERLEEDLAASQIRIVFLIDGLEDIFQETTANISEQNAIVALCRELIGEIGTKYSHIGFMVFLRKDIARDSVKVNFEQFYTIYRAYELKWSSTEALRLAVWLVNQAVPGLYQGESSIEFAPKEALDKSLELLWGVKLGKKTSNEANSSRWILAALSDFNGQLQARDIIRFLKYATATAGTDYYEDRYLMPAEIKKAVSKCSVEKVDETSQEIKALKQIFDKLKNGSEAQRSLPFYSDTFNLSASEEKLMKQEGYLRVENEKYYLPEIARHALNFKYEKGARPKVLSLTLKQHYSL